MGYPWSEDLISRRLINILYNYEYINSSSTVAENKILNKIIIYHMYRVIFDIRNKKLSAITSYDILASTLSFFILNKKNKINFEFINQIISKQIDNLGMHKSYNVVEHAKFLNNLNELKNILLYFGQNISQKIDQNIIKMTSILNEYFHKDGSIPLFNGSNNNYNKIIYNSINKEEYLKSRRFSNTKNGLAFLKTKK